MLHFFFFVKFCVCVRMYGVYMCAYVCVCLSMKMILWVALYLQLFSQSLESVCLACESLGILLPLCQSLGSLLPLCPIFPTGELGLETGPPVIQIQAPEFSGQALSCGAGQPPMFHSQCDIFLGLLLARVVGCLEMSLCGGSKWT